MPVYWPVKLFLREQFKAAAKAKNLPADQLKPGTKLRPIPPSYELFSRMPTTLPPANAQWASYDFCQRCHAVQRIAGYRPQDAERAKSLMVLPTVKSKALEEAYLAAHLTEAQAALGNDDPYVKAALTGPDGKTRTPKEAAAYLVKNTKLTDPAFISELTTRPNVASSIE